MKSTANNKSEVDTFLQPIRECTPEPFFHMRAPQQHRHKKYTPTMLPPRHSPKQCHKKKYIHDAFKIELWRPIHHIITSSQRLDVDGLCYHRAAHTALPRLNMKKQFRIACLQSMAGRADGALQIVDVEYSIARFEIYLLYV